jgi:hypothetical protein
MAMYRWVCMLIAVWLIAACATIPQPSSSTLEPTKLSVPQTTQSGWWYVRFQMVWPEDKEPNWSLDALLAKEVCAPVLNDYAAALPLWRFHRRAGRDGGGHQFSLIFYSTPQAAANVNQSLSSNPLLAQLQRKGILQTVSYDDTSSVLKPAIEATSDPAWSPSIARSWPYFIMGVSQLWLKLVAETSVELHKEAPSSNKDLLNHYRMVHNQVTALWENEGTHAFLHHLNALFAYQPTLVREQRALSF